MDFASFEVMSQKQKPSSGPGQSGYTPPTKKANIANEGPKGHIPEVPEFPQGEPSAAEIMSALKLMHSDLKQVKEKISVVDEVKGQVDEMKNEMSSLTQRVVNLERSEASASTSPSRAKGSAWGRSEGGAVHGEGEERNKKSERGVAHESEEREREIKELERRQVYVNGFPYATDKKYIIEKLESIVKDVRESGEEVQVRCNLIKSSFGVLVFPSNVERETFLRRKWGGSGAMDDDEMYENRKLRYSRPSTKEDRHIGRCLAKAKRAMCEQEMPSEEIVICRRGKRVWWGNKCVARYDARNETIKFEDEELKNKVDMEKLTVEFKELMEKAE